MLPDDQKIIEIPYVKIPITGTFLYFCQKIKT
jgi:hypothetical protein